MKIIQYYILYDYTFYKLPMNIKISVKKYKRSMYYFFNGKNILTTAIFVSGM